VHHQTSQASNDAFTLFRSLLLLFPFNTLLLYLMSSLYLPLNGTNPVFRLRIAPSNPTSTAYDLLIEIRDMSTPAALMAWIKARKFEGVG
jgi:hypothetical protein